MEQLPPHKSHLATSPSTPGLGPADTCDLLPMVGLQAWREHGLWWVFLLCPVLPLCVLYLVGVGVGLDALTEQPLDTR